jgi:uncharacterized protein YdhG (YjbR/CyaY superfamily)
MMAVAKDVDEYIASVPAEYRGTVEKLRKLITAAAPEATESISYGVPTYKIGGRPLVYFGTAKPHFALYGVSGVIRETYKDELAGCSMSKGTIRFPWDKPFPGALIKKLVKACLAERKAAAK